MAASQSIAAVPGAVADEVAEVVAAGEPYAVGDDQSGGGLERVEARGSGPERGRE